MRSFATLGLVLVTLSPAQQVAARAGDPQLRLEVAGKGTITIQLYPDRAPKTVAQVVRLAKSGFYNDLPFFRVERTPKPYLAWFGDPKARANADAPNLGANGSGTRVPYESNTLRHVTGAVGLARPLDDKDGGDSVFYIVLDKSTFLDGRYTVFGQVVGGADVLARLAKGDRVTRAAVLN